MELNTELYKNYYRINEESKAVITQMVLETIKNITDFKITEHSDESRYDIGTNFTEVPLASAYVIEDIITGLGYEQVDFDKNGWEMDFWIHYRHKDSNYPPLCISGTGITKEVYLRGEQKDFETYEERDEKLKADPEYQRLIQKGMDIIKREENIIGEQNNE